VRAAAAVARTFQLPSADSGEKLFQPNSCADCHTGVKAPENLMKNDSRVATTMWKRARSSSLEDRLKNQTLTDIAADIVESPAQDEAAATGPGRRRRCGRSSHTSGPGNTSLAEEMRPAGRRSSPGSIVLRVMTIPPAARPIWVRVKALTPTSPWSRPCGNMDRTCWNYEPDEAGVAAVSGSSDVGPDRLLEFAVKPEGGLRIQSNSRATHSSIWSPHSRVLGSCEFPVKISAPLV